MDYNKSKLYINKQLSWIKFNKRVLEEAWRKDTPLLERLKFLAITASNLDEFIMIRVARLKDQIKHGYNSADKCGLKPKEIYLKVTKRLHQLVKQQYYCWRLLKKELVKEGICFSKYADLDLKDKKYLNSYFSQQIEPVLTPRAIDQSRPFPLILNKSLNLAILLKSRDKEQLFPHKAGRQLFAVIRVPKILPRLIKLPSQDGKVKFIFLEDLIKAHLDKIFPGYIINAVSSFRITRNADLDLNEQAGNLLLEMKKYVKKREKGFPVRLEVEAGMDLTIRSFLKKSLNLREEDIYQIVGPIDLTPFFEIEALKDYNHLKFQPLPPNQAIDFYQQDIFAAIKKEDRLLHLPYESFNPITEFVKKAANDSQVLAIKQTLYRVSGSSPIIAALAKAAKNGKQVTVLVELKARFDEQKNIEWAQKLEDAGCHVVYGLVGFKVHAKLLLVVRREDDGIKRYVHLSTGNYNDQTAKIYTDMSMFSCKDKFASDVSFLFNLLTGYAKAPKWKKLSVGPLNLREAFIELIKNEIKQAEAGKQAHIVAKMNALIDKEIIKALYKASQKGVKIDLIVRDMCCLRPGLKDLSENIRVISIVGRLLEHSRIYYFANGGEAKVFLSSADLRPRNLDRRIEVLFPVERKSLQQRIITSLKLMLNDTVKARELKSDGSYQNLKTNSKKEVDSQLEIYKVSKKRLKRLQAQLKEKEYNKKNN